MLDDDRRQKIFWMKIIITVLTIFIIVAWAFNFHNLWREKNFVSPTSRANQQSLIRMSRQFNQAIKNIQIQLNNSSSSKSISILSASSSKFLNQVLQKTKNISSTTNFNRSSKSISSSSVSFPLIPLTTSTASSSHNFFNNTTQGCPQYINCMPTIGGVAKNCQVPPGCENITTLVY